MICDPSLFAIGVGYVNDAYCALIGAARETLLGSTQIRCHHCSKAAPACCRTARHA